MKTVRRKMLVLPLLFLGTFVMANDTPKVLFDFTGANAATAWQTVNDGVMGGVSEGKFKITSSPPHAGSSQAAATAPHLRDAFARRGPVPSPEVRWLPLVSNPVGFVVPGPRQGKDDLAQSPCLRHR